MHPPSVKISALYHHYSKSYCTNLVQFSFLPSPFSSKTLCACHFWVNLAIWQFPTKNSHFGYHKYPKIKTICLQLVYLQHNGLCTACIPAPPPNFDWHSEDQQQAFEEWKGQIILALTASNFREEIWFATIISYLGKEGFKRWNTLPISKDAEARKNPEAVFKAIADTFRSINLLLELH